MGRIILVVYKSHMVHEKEPSASEPTYCVAEEMYYI
jgi:hypothetical protein